MRILRKNAEKFPHPPRIRQSKKKEVEREDWEKAGRVLTEEEGEGGGSVLKRTYIKTGKYSKPHGKTNGMVPVKGKIKGSSKATGAKKGGGKGGGGEAQESPSSEMPTRRCVCIQIYVCVYSHANIVYNHMQIYV